MRHLKHLSRPSVLLTATALVLGCSGSDGIAGTPCQGRVRCDCYPNSTCNAGLVCLSNLCVAPSDGAAGGVEDVSQAPDASGHGDGAGGEASGKGMDTGPGGPDASETNFVTNGDFSQGTTSWAVVYGTGSLAASAGELCVSATANQPVTIGWPEPAGTPGVVLSSGASYTLSYSARATQSGLAVDAKVGHTLPPYASDFETPNDAVTTSPQTFTHTFTSPADSSAGLAFGFQATVTEQICFQNVRLVQN